MSEILKLKYVDPDDFYTVTETAILLRLDRSHVRRLCDQGALGPLWRKTPNPRSTRLITGQAILEFADARKETS